MLNGANLTSTWNAAPPYQRTQAQMLNEVDQLHAAGGDILRMWVDWAVWQNPIGGTTWDTGYEKRVDAIFSRADSYGMEILAQIFSSRVAAGLDTPAQAVSHIGEPVTRALNTWPYLYGIEIWNEPNNSGFWGANGGTTAQMAQIVNNAVAAKAAVSGATTKIVACGLLGQGNGGTADAYYNSLRANGMSGYDEMGVHPYSSFGNPPTFICPCRGLPASPFKVCLRNLRSAMVASEGGGVKPMHVSEFGFSHSPGIPAMTKATQKAWNRSTFRILAAEFPYVTAAEVFNLYDMGTYTGGTAWDSWTGIDDTATYGSAIDPWVLDRD